MLKLIKHTSIVLPFLVTLGCSNLLHADIHLEAQTEQQEHNKIKSSFGQADTSTVACRTAALQYQNILQTTILAQGTSANSPTNTSSNYTVPDSLHANESDITSNYPFSFEASYIGDLYENAAGGIKTGGNFMGMANLTIEFDIEKAGWWKGGSFFINGATLHGKSLTENFLGDLQVASNIDAGEHTYLHALWFKQKFEKFFFTLGLQDLNADFLASENAGEFINSSFGVIPTISGNLPLPIFPLTGLGISAQWNINEQFLWQTVLFDGCQAPFEHNPYNLDWKFQKNDGLLLVTELHSKFNIANKEGTYKIGAYYHSGLNEFNEETQALDTIFDHNYGFYIIADQIVYEQQNSKIGVFAQLSSAPKSKNQSSYYIGLGANYFGLFSNEWKDVLGVGIANIALHNMRNSHETAIEVFYKWQFNDNFGIQPDIQYIINPAGTEQPFSNVLVGILRFHINF